MINGSVTIQWLDIDHRTANNTTVRELFKTYSDKMLPCKDPCEYEIRFGKDLPAVKIRDLFGWSRLLCIKKKYIYDAPEKWNSLETHCSGSGNSKIVLTNDSIIPVYDEQLHSSVGFHGERKYGYIIRSINMMRNQDRIRVLNKISNQLGGGTKVEFVTGTISSANSDEYFIDECGYEIYTKSGFYNASQIGKCKYHLFASEGKVNGNNIKYK